MAKEYIEREAALSICNEMIAEPWNSKTAPASWADAYLEFMDAVEHFPAADVIQVPNTGIGDVSDGYHTFNELYHHRAVLFSVICNLMPEKAWKSKQHYTGDMYDGMFIAGIETPEGQATYHCDIDPYWDMFRVKELERAPKWDGHTPSDAIERIGALPAADLVEVVRCKDCKHLMFSDCYGECGKGYMGIVNHDDFCSYGERRECAK